MVKLSHTEEMTVIKQDDVDRIVAALEECADVLKELRHREERSHATERNRLFPAHMCRNGCGPMERRMHGHHCYTCGNYDEHGS